MAAGRASAIPAANTGVISLPSGLIDPDWIPALTNLDSTFQIVDDSDATKIVKFSNGNAATATTTTIALAANAASRTYNLPLVTATDTLVALASTNAFTGTNSMLDGSFTILNTATPSKIIKFSATSITAANTRTYTMPDASGTIPLLSLAQTWTAIQTIQIANGLKVLAASTQDAIIVAGRAGGSTSLTNTLTTAALAGSVTCTLPATTTTLAGLAVAETFSALQTFTAGITLTTTALTITDVNIVLNTTTGTKIGTATTQKLSFYNSTPIVQPTDGATLTNNVTSGGSSDTIANYTDLTLYANDSAAIRNNIYQLARKLKIVVDNLRSLGLES